MSHPLDGAYLKLGRAWHHAKEVKTYTETFRRTNAYPIRVEVDQDAGRKRWILEEGYDVPPVEMSIVLGEAFYQFRSALDHLAWELVKANGEQPTRRTAFPICLEIEEWEYRRTREKVRGMHDDAIAIIKREQPCFGGHPHRTRWFKWLDDLWNVDKHRHLYIPLSGSGGGFWSHPLPMYGVESFIHTGTVKPGTILASIDGDYADVEFLPVKDVVLGEGVLAAGESAYQLMFRMDSLVGNTLAMFRDFFPPRDSSQDAPRPSSHPQGGW